PPAASGNVVRRGNAWPVTEDAVGGFQEKDRGYGRQEARTTPPAAGRGKPAREAQAAGRPGGLGAARADGVRGVAHRVPHVERGERGRRGLLRRGFGLRRGAGQPLVAFPRAADHVLGDAAVPGDGVDGVAGHEAAVALAAAVAAVVLGAGDQRVPDPGGVDLAAGLLHVVPAVAGDGHGGLRAGAVAPSRGCAGRHLGQLAAGQRPGRAGPGAGAAGLGHGPAGAARGPAPARAGRAPRALRRKVLRRLLVPEVQRAEARLRRRGQAPALRGVFAERPQQRHRLRLRQRGHLFLSDLGDRRAPVHRRAEPGAARGDEWIRPGARARAVARVPGGPGNGNAAPWAAFLFLFPVPGGGAAAVPGGSVAVALAVVDRGFLAGERVELADGPRVVGPVALQVRVVRGVLLEHAPGIRGEGFVAQLGVGGGQDGDRVVLELALRVGLEQVLRTRGGGDPGAAA